MIWALILPNSTPQQAENQEPGHPEPEQLMTFVTQMQLKTPQI